MGALLSASKKLEEEEEEEKVEFIFYDQHGILRRGVKSEDGCEHNRVSSAKKACDSSNMSVIQVRISYHFMDYLMTSSWHMSVCWLAAPYIIHDNYLHFVNQGRRAAARAFTRDRRL